MSTARIYVISDLHLDHKAITKYRSQFETVEEHNETITENILKTVTKKDTLWILGDTCFSLESVKYMRRIREAVGTLKLVLGNHCTDSAERREALRELYGMADQVHGLAREKKFLMSHAPIHPDELRGKFNVHGHVHSETIDDYRYVNVCCENVNYFPIGMDDIKKGWRGY